MYIFLCVGRYENSIQVRGPRVTTLIHVLICKGERSMLAPHETLKLVDQIFLNKKNFSVFLQIY